MIIVMLSILQVLVLCFALLVRILPSVTFIACCEWVLCFYFIFLHVDHLQTAAL